MPQVERSALWEGWTQSARRYALEPLSLGIAQRENGLFQRHHIPAPRRTTPRRCQPPTGPHQELRAGQVSEAFHGVGMPGLLFNLAELVEQRLGFARE